MKRQTVMNYGPANVTVEFIEHGIELTFTLACLNGTHFQTATAIQATGQWIQVC